MSSQSVFHSQDSDHPSPLEQSFDREDIDSRGNASMILENPAQESEKPSDPPPELTLFVPLKMYFQDIHRRPSPRETVYMLYAIHRIFSGEQSFNEEDRVREIARGLWIDEEDLTEALQKRELTSNLMEKFLKRLCREDDHFLSLASSDLIEKSMEVNPSEYYRPVFTKVDWEDIPADIEHVEGMNYYQGVLFTSPPNFKERGYFVGCTPSKRYSILLGTVGEYEEIFSEKIDLVSHTFLTRLLDVPRSGKLHSLGCDTVQYRSHCHRGLNESHNGGTGYMFPNQVLYNYSKELFSHIVLHSCDSSIRHWIYRVFYRSSFSSCQMQWGSAHSTDPTPYPYTPNENLPERGYHSLETWNAEMEYRRRVLTPLAAEIHEKIVYALRVLRTEKSRRYQITWDNSNFEPRQEWFGIHPEIDTFLITPQFVTTTLEDYTRRPSLSGMRKFLTIYRLANQKSESYLNRPYIEVFLQVTLERGSIEEYQAYLDTYHEMIKEGRRPSFGLDFRQVYDTLHKRSIMKPLREEFLPFHRLVVESLEELGNNEELIQRLEELI